jgi:hypothetical protein
MMSLVRRTAVALRPPQDSLGRAAEVAYGALTLVGRRLRSLGAPPLRASPWHRVRADVLGLDRGGRR